MPVGGPVDRHSWPAWPSCNDAEAPSAALWELGVVADTRFCTLRWLVIYSAPVAVCYPSSLAQYNTPLSLASFVIFTKFIAKLLGTVRGLRLAAVHARFRMC